MLVNSSTSFSAGCYAEILQNNGAWDTNPASWAENSVGQIVRITAVNGNLLTLEDPLRISYIAELQPRIRPIDPAAAVSIEYMHLERTSSNTATAGYNISFNMAANARVCGVESNKSQGSHCMISASTHITVEGSYFHHAFVYDGSGTKGYGVTLMHHTGSCLITDNIFRYLRHAMMVKQGANGNVFGYNYSREVNRSEFPSGYGGDVSLHGHYAYANLFEGNIVQMIHIDDYWGPSGPCNTFFRNRTEGYGIVMTTNLTNQSNFVGNEILNNFPMGLYTITGSGNFLHGNNKNGTITPAGTAYLPQTSYYLIAQPLFWNIPDPPGIGTPNTLNTYTIPAKYRYEIGQYTYTDDSLYVSTTNPGNDKSLTEKHKPVLSIFPNPAKDHIILQYNEATDDRNYLTNGREHQVEIIQLQGKITKEVNFKGSLRQLNISDYPAGTYVARLRNHPSEAVLWIKL